jgi:hypothetical protein
MKNFKLDNQPKITSGFTTPDDYFDTFSEKILAKLPKQEPKVISVFNYKKTWFFAAAAVLVIWLSIPIYNDFEVNSKKMKQLF